jgi:hyperosmotically inducible protein
MNKFSRSTAAMLFAAVAMTACDKRDAPQPKVEPGSVAEKAERKIEEVRAEARRELAEAKEKVRDVGREAKAGGDQASSDVRQAGTEAGDKVTDAVITTTVNAEFARDSSLSATKIDVDTAGGRVALRGTAPSTDARERATQLAAHVKGVRSVDNQLVVEPAKM